MNEEHFRRLERMFSLAPINEYLHSKVEVQKGVAEVKLEVGSHLFHPGQATHGMVYFAMLDNSAWFAVSSLVEDVFVLTSNFTVELLRPLIDGQIRARGEVIHQSRDRFIAESVLYDAKGKKAGLGRGSFVKGAQRLDGMEVYK